MASVPAVLRVLGCVILAVLLGAAPAQAVVPAGNLLANPGAEADVGSTDTSWRAGVPRTPSRPPSRPRP